VLSVPIKRWVCQDAGQPFNFYLVGKVLKLFHRRKNLKTHVVYFIKMSRRKHIQMRTRRLLTSASRKATFSSRSPMNRSLSSMTVREFCSWITKQTKTDRRCDTRSGGGSLIAYSWRGTFCFQHTFLLDSTPAHQLLFMGPPPQHLISLLMALCAVVGTGAPHLHAVCVCVCVCTFHCS